MLGVPMELEREMREQPTTIAILGADAVVENALAQLLEGEGYSTKVLKPFPMREALEEGMPDIGGVHLVILTPSLSPSESEAFLAARRRRTTPQRTTTSPSPIPVIVLTSPTGEAPALLEGEQAARSVPWPTTRERLVREIEDLLLEARFPTRAESNRRTEDGIHR
jgi:CheY-like chemotaxis protein